MIPPSAPPGLRPALRRIGAALLAASSALLAACPGESDVYGGLGSGAPPAVAGFSLGEHHAHAERWQEVAEVWPASFRDRRLLGSGWSYPNASDDEGLRERAEIWTDAVRADVLLYVGEPAPRRVELHARPFAPEGQDEIGLELNGTTLGTWPAGPNGVEIAVDLPAELQLPGRNVLSLSTTAVRRVADHQTDSKDPRRLGLSVGRIRIRIQDEAVRDRVEAARSLVQGGSRVRTLGGGRTAVEQVSGSALAYHVALVPESRLVGQLVFADRAGDADAARFVVRRIGLDGEPATVLDRVVDYGESVPVDVPLGADRAAPFELSFAVEPLDPDEGPVVGAWLDAAVTPLVDPPAEATQEPAALARARERLRGAPVVLVLLDALNPAYLTPYGGREDLTPNLQRFAEESALYERAYAQATYTISSVASILTSTYAWQHGTWTEGCRLPDPMRTWPEVFRDGGYRTAAVVHSPNGSSLFGFERGFEQYIEVFRDREGKNRVPHAEEVLPALDQVLAQNDERPLFLWLHVLEPHEPYEPPKPWRGSLGSDEVGGLPPTYETIRALALRAVVPTEEDLEGLRRAYQENLAYVDDVMGRVFARLEAAGIYDEAIVAVFSDHGEGFGRHEGKLLAAIGHGSTTYEEMARIPMIVRLPGDVAPRGVRPEGLVAAIDLGPTVADLVGLPRVPAATPGTSFAASLFDAGAPARRFAASHAASARPDRFLPVSLAIWSADGAKYVHHNGGERSLFDLSADPYEERDLSAERDVLAAYLREELSRLSGLDLDRGALVRSEGGGEIDEELRAQLDALGY